MYDKNASTQTVAEVVELLSYLGKPANPLPEIVPLADGSHLTKSSKSDVYYFASQEFCTCPGFHYRGTCRHLKALASMRPHSQSMAKVLEQHDTNLQKMPASYRRMVRAARDEAESHQELRPEGSFKPFLE